MTGDRQPQGFSLTRFIVRNAPVFALGGLAAAGWILLWDDSSGPGSAVLGGYRERWFLLNVVVSYLALWTALLRTLKFRKTTLFRILAVHFGLLVVFALLEASAMVGLIDFRDFKNRGGAYEVRPEERLPRVGLPNLRLEGEAYQELTTTDVLGVVESAPIKWEFQTDRFGLRNPSDKNDPAVLCLGDSILVGGLLPVNDIVTERLEAILNVPVINVSEVGYGPQEELLRLKGTELDVNGKIVLHFVFEGNDLFDSREWREWDKKRLTADWPASGLLRFLLGALHKWKGGVGDRRFGFYTDAEREKSKVYFFYDAKRINRQMGEIGVLESVFTEAKRDIEAKGGVYAMVFVPAKISVLHPYCTWPEGSDLESPDLWKSAFSSALAEIASRIGIPYRDVTGHLQTLADQGRLPYFCVDTHLNSLGHDAMASFLAPWVRSLMKSAQAR